MVDTPDETATKEISVISELQAKAQTGYEAAKLLEFAQHYYLGPRSARIRKEIFALIMSGKPLDASKAIQAWMQLFEAHQLVSDLAHKQKRGIQAAEKLEKLTQKKH